MSTDSEILNVSSHIINKPITFSAVFSLFLKKDQITLQDFKLLDFPFKIYIQISSATPPVFYYAEIIRYKTCARAP